MLDANRRYQHSLCLLQVRNFRMSVCFTWLVESPNNRKVAFFRFPRKEDEGRRFLGETFDGKKFKTYNENNFRRARNIEPDEHKGYDYLSAGVNFLYPFWTHRLWLDATRRFPDGTGMGRFVMLWSIYKDLSFFQKTNLVGKKTKTKLYYSVNIDIIILV